MFPQQLWTSWGDTATVLVSSAAILVATIVVIRIVGLRSFSKMSSFDFAVTVAIGSIIASVSVASTPLANGMLGVAALFGVQSTIATLRRRRSLDRAVDNTPMLLMYDGELYAAALDACRVTRSDVFAKLREANVLRTTEVRAVVLETTGDISVLHGDGPVDDELLDNVRTLG